MGGNSRKLSDNISSRIVQTYVQSGRSQGGVKDTVASGHGASKLGCRFPDDLSEVVIGRLKWVELIYQSRTSVIKICWSTQWGSLREQRNSLTGIK